MLNWFVGLFHIHQWGRWCDPFIQTTNYINSENKISQTSKTPKQARMCNTCGKIDERTIF